MSDQGIKILNSKNQIQIDSYYHNFYLYDEGENIQGPYYYINNVISISDYIKYGYICFVKKDANEPWVQTCLYKRSDYIDCLNLSNVFFQSFSSTVYKYRIYSTNPAIVSTPEYGIEIKNASQETVFNSNYKPLILEKIHLITHNENAHLHISIPYVYNYMFLVASRLYNFFTIFNGIYYQKYQRQYFKNGDGIDIYCPDSGWGAGYAYGYELPEGNDYWDSNITLLQFKA